MSLTAQVRADMRDALTGLVLDGKAVPVHMLPPRALTGPCIVIEPADPMLARKTMTRFEVRQEAACVVPVKDSDTFDVTLERLESLAEWVLTHWPHVEPASAPVQAQYGAAKVALVSVPLTDLLTIETE